MKKGSKTYYESWSISDDLWNVIKEEIPIYRRDESREYERRVGGGRKAPDYRCIVSGIFNVLRTGCPWKAIPAEYGKGSNIHRYFQLWEKEGFFTRIWMKGLEKYDDIIGINWEWQSVDGSMNKSPLAQESVGKNPTDRGKNGDKTQYSCRRRRRAPSGCDI
jgi:transposase